MYRWDRLPKGNVGRRDTSNVKLHMRSFKRISEAVALLKTQLKQGTAIDPQAYVELLRRCLKHEDVVATKQVHECIIESGMEQNTQIANNLLMVYLRCGKLQEARRVFDKLENKEIISWNIMIGGYRPQGAIKLYNQMRLEPNEITYLNILKACTTPTALKLGKEIHESIRARGFESDVRVGTALLRMYAKCGRLKEARKVFENLASRNVITWNVMIGAYAQSGYGKEAYELLQEMKQEGLTPDAITYTSILNASASFEALDWVREVHKDIMQAGLASDLQLGNALVHMYAKSGSVHEARQVFDRMTNRDVITWNVMIGACEAVEAYQLFQQMLLSGCKPNSITYTCILNACVSAGASDELKNVHSHLQKAGLESELGNVLIQGYAKTGNTDAARSVFNRMKKRNIITWNVMIGASRDWEAYPLFLQMIQEGVKPNVVTYLSLLKESATRFVKDIHQHIIEAGLESDLRVGSALVHVYAKSNNISEARSVFDRMEHHDVVTWTTMIGAYAENGHGLEAYQLFLQMIQTSAKPNAITYTSILNPSASAGALEWVRDIHHHAHNSGLDSDIRVGSALVHMYAKSGSIEEARAAFNAMEERDLITWNVMIGGLAQHGCGSEALNLFKHMDVKPDGATYVALLSACSHAGLVDEGRAIFTSMDIEPTVVHYTCMVDLLARAGHLEEAKVFIDSMPVKPNAATWGALLGACNSYGNVEIGELAAKERIKLEPEDASTFVMLSNLYASAGKVQEVSLLRTMMQERGVRKEPGRSWIHVYDEVHEFVAGDTSHLESEAIYAELTRLTESIKAEATFRILALCCMILTRRTKRLLCVLIVRSLPLLMDSFILLLMSLFTFSRTFGSVRIAILQRSSYLR